MHFYPFFELMYVGQLDDHTPRMNYINALCINLSYLPKNQSLKFSQKILRIGELENDIFWNSAFGYWVFQKILFFVFSQWKLAWLSYEASFISALLNLGKDFIRTNMQTTIIHIKPLLSLELYKLISSKYTL